MSTQIQKVEGKANTSFVRPRVDVFENEAEYLLVADLPGVGKESVSVRFENGELTLEGGEFQRGFAMPEGIDPETIAATIANGVLSVHVPKAAAKRARRSDVRAG